MRVVFDELFNLSDDDNEMISLAAKGEGTYSNEEESPLSSPQLDYTYINESEEDQHIPHLRLPKKHEAIVVVQVAKLSVFDETDKKREEKLDPEIIDMINSINLDSKLPSTYKSFPLPIINKYVPTRGVEKDICIEKAKNETSNTVEAILLLRNSFESKLRSLASKNKKQVEAVKERKRREEEERLKRKVEEEHKIKEEEDRLRKEAEDRKRREEEERKRNEEEDRVRSDKEKRLQAEARLKEEQFKLKQEKYASNREKELTNFNEIEKLFTHYKMKIKEIKNEIVEPVKNGDKSMKAILSKHKRKINPKFGQLTNSNTQLHNVCNELIKLVDETKVDQLSYLWVLNFISKAIVSQAETEVRVKPESSLPLGKLCIILMIKYDELKELLLARFVKKCPYVIGYSCSIDTEEGRLRMGWKRNDGTKWEEDTTYDERMSGMVTLYSVITRLPIPVEYSSNNQTPHPIPISESWKLLARFCNVDKELLTNTHFIIIGAWWDATAKEFLEKYNSQGAKLLKLVGTNLISSVSDQKYIGAARLSILFEEWITSNTIKSFPRMDS